MKFIINDKLFSNGNYEKDLKKACDMKLDKRLKRLMKEKYESVLFNQQLSLQNIAIDKDELEEEERNSADSKMKQHKLKKLSNSLVISGEYIYKSLMIYGLVATEHDFARIMNVSIDKIEGCIQRYDLEKEKKGYLFILLILCGELEDFSDGTFFEAVACNITVLTEEFKCLLEESKQLPEVYGPLIKEYELYPRELRLCSKEHEVLSVEEEILRNEQLEVLYKIGSIAEKNILLERVPEFNCLQEGA
ncbi:hypothetical protein [Clostridium estertheticum]|uniref:hypothetical protein n=1 Tax=Clostridium estertheticum TaxID=238834 RepID=UPI001C0D2498|nr:hypothetical protein [Clostridium estertheticum]MBU3075616.1 hypothetical protein [Clostridium estertheticum]MBU3164802.1 hypothetical protein [Clostridium estertheticum]